MNEIINNIKMIEEQKFNEMLLTGFGYIRQNIKPNYNFDNQTEKKV